MIRKPDELGMGDVVNVLDDLLRFLEHDERIRFSLDPSKNVCIDLFSEY